MNGRSVGKVIEDRRKELGLTLEECSKRTRISKKFLEAIEADNYDMFPGEVYYIGFLRNYAQILSLDANKLIHDYHKQKKLEEPAPLEELTKPLKREIKLPTYNKNSLPIIMISIIVIILIVGIILLFSVPKTQNVDIAKSDVKNKIQKNDNEFVLLQRRTIKSFLPNEVLVIPDGDYQYKINILSINNDSKKTEISISNIQSPFVLSEKDILKLDFNENNEFDIQIIVNKISSEGLNLTIERLTTEKGTGNLTDKNISIVSSSSPQSENINLQPISLTNQISVVIQANRNGYVRLESDSEGVIEKLLSPTESIKIGGNNQVIIQLTNANSMTVTINGNPLQLPKEFVIYCIVKWVYDQQTNRYNLITEFKK